MAIVTYGPSLALESGNIFVTIQGRMELRALPFACV